MSLSRENCYEGAKDVGSSSSQNDVRKDSQRVFVMSRKEEKKETDVDDSQLIVIPEEGSTNAFYDENRDGLNYKIINRIEYMLESDKSQVCVFKYQDCYIGVKREMIPEILQDMITYAARSDIENYELAGAAHKLYTRITRN